VRILAALLIAAASLIETGCVKAAAAPTLESFLAGLPSALSAAGSAEQVRGVVNAAPPEVSVTDATAPDTGLNLQLHFPATEASWLVTTWQLARPYATATDAHQLSWRVVLYKQDVSDPGNARIAVDPIKSGNWTITPRLEGRPEGALPPEVAGASPAYDLTRYSARVIGIDIAGQGA
jgi:hypothetical protein